MKTALTFCSKCCLWHHVIGEAVKPKNISSDAQMLGGIGTRGQKSVCSPSFFFKAFCAFCCTFMSFIFCSLCHCSLSRIVYSHLCFCSTSALLSTLIFCPDKWCLCLLQCAFPFGLAFILAM